MRWRLALASCVGVLTLLASACGSGQLDPAPPVDLGRAEQLLSDREIARSAPGSPQQALLTWWRNVQFRNYEGYLELYTKSTRRVAARKQSGLPRFLLLADELRTAKPRIFEADAQGDTATLFTEISTRHPTASKRFMTIKTPQAFVLRREKGLWRLVDTVFADLTLAPIYEARAKQEEQGKQKR